MGRPWVSRHLLEGAGGVADPDDLEGRLELDEALDDVVDRDVRGPGHEHLLLALAQLLDDLADRLRLARARRPVDQRVEVAGEAPLHGQPLPLVQGAVEPGLDFGQRFVALLEGFAQAEEGSDQLVVRRSDMGLVVLQPSKALLIPGS
jgi:hypothetical protein